MFSEGITDAKNHSKGFILISYRVVCICVGLHGSEVSQYNKMLIIKKALRFSHH